MTAEARLRCFWHCCLKFYSKIRSCLKPFLCHLLRDIYYAYAFDMYDIGRLLVFVRIRACRKWNTGKFANVQIIYPRLRRRSVERVALKLCKSSIILCSRACDPTVDHFAMLLLLAVLFFSFRNYKNLTIRLYNITVRVDRQYWYIAPQFNQVEIKWLLP